MQGQVNFTCCLSHGNSSVLFNDFCGKFIEITHTQIIITKLYPPLRLLASSSSNINVSTTCVTTCMKAIPSSEKDKPLRSIKGKR